MAAEPKPIVLDRPLRGRIYDSIAETIGNTPLVRLQRLPGPEQARRGNLILGKLEGNNPAGSVKDRPALSMIQRAQERGEIKPGDTLIEATSGNTGIALAFVAAARGYPITLTMPETMSVERRKVLKAFGANLLLTDGTLGMKGAIGKAEQLAAENPGKYVLLQQFKNPANPAIHERTALAMNSGPLSRRMA